MAVLRPLFSLSWLEHCSVETEVASGDEVDEASRLKSVRELNVKTSIESVHLRVS